jgi:putative membrane protein
MIVAKTGRLSALSGTLGRTLASLFAYDVAIAAAYVFGAWHWLALPDIPLSIFGGVIGVIVGFRNASAYARWWEARTIWGGIVNNSRSFGRQVMSMMSTAEEPESSEMKRRLLMLQIGYVHALRNHLRGNPPWEDLAGFVPEEDIQRLRTHNNVPLAIQQNMATIVARCHQLGWIDSMRWVALDRTLTALMDGQGASERIKNTPMPRQYDLFIRLFINVYCVLLPLGMVASLQLLTPVGSTLVGFMFLALDQIGRDLELPFEDRPHDISLTAISRTIEINLKQMLGEVNTPEPLVPVDGILW